MGSVIPAAQARPNHGGYQNSLEARRKKQDRCDHLHTTYKDLGPIADAALDAHDAATATKAIDDSRTVLDTAKAAGCGWAARVVPPSLRLPPQTLPGPCRRWAGRRTIRRPLTRVPFVDPRSSGEGAA
jgi:hypothetical protein